MTSYFGLISTDRLLAVEAIGVGSGGGGVGTRTSPIIEVGFVPSIIYYSGFFYIYNFYYVFMIFIVFC